MTIGAGVACCRPDTYGVADRRRGAMGDGRWMGGDGCRCRCKRVGDGTEEGVGWLLSLLKSELVVAGVKQPRADGLLLSCRVQYCQGRERVLSSLAWGLEITVCTLLLGGKLPLPPLWRGRVICTVAALEEPYPDRYLPQGMKPTLQNLANARRGSSLPRDFLAGHPGSVRERSRSRSPPPFPGRIPLWRPRRVCFLTCPLSSSQTIRPTPSAPGHVAIKDSAHRPVVQEKSQTLNLECLASLFSRNLEETWFLSGIYCCGDDLAMAKDMPFLFLSLPFAVISARSASCERRSPRTSTAGGLGRDVPKSIP